MFSGGLVLAAVALVAVLPEFVIEVHFAFIQEAELVTANLTGATRLLLTGATALPLLVAFFAHRRGQIAPSIRLANPRRLELGILLVVAVFEAQVVVRGSLTVFDGVLLLGLYVLYARRVQGTPDEEPAVVGVGAGLMTLPETYRRPAVAGLILGAGAVVVTIANPFTQSLLATGASVGIDPYLMIQSVVPVATEAPELVVVAVLVASRRPAQGLALFLASSVSQSTLGLGSLAYRLSRGGWRHRPSARPARAARACLHRRGHPLRGRRSRHHAPRTSRRRASGRRLRDTTGVARAVHPIGRGVRLVRVRDQSPHRATTSHPTTTESRLRTEGPWRAGPAGGVMPGT